MSKKYTTNFLEDTNGSTGSANQVLISTPSGIDWVDGSGSGIIGGPYLPLAGGTMTGDLLMDGKAGVGNVIGLATGINSNAMSLKLYTYNNIDPGGGLGTSTGNMIQADLGSNLVLRQTASDGDITFQSDDGSGGIATYLTLDGSSTDAYFSNPGNVGIGTTSPQEKMHVSGSSNIRLEVEATDSTVAALKLTNTAGSYASYVNASGSLSTYDYNAASVRTTLLTNGNFGIGTTNPSYKLEVSGTLGVSRTDGIIFAGSSGLGTGSKIVSNTSNDLIFNTALASLPYTTTERVRVLNNGNVGIGTTSPADKLEIKDGSIGLNSTSSYPSTNIIKATWNGSTSPLMGSIGWFQNPGFVGSEWSHYKQISPYTQARIRLIGDASGQMNVNLNNSQVFTILASNGGVGIANTNPTGLLVVGAGTSNTGHRSNTLLSEEATGSTANSLGLVNSALGAYGNETALNFHLSRTYSPTARIIAYQDGGSSQTDTGLKFFTYNGSLQQRMTIDHDGNVGIGTTSPGEKLEVSGSIKGDEYKGYLPAFQHGGFYHSSSASSSTIYWIPTNYISETTSSQYYNNWIAPYSGRVKKIVMRYASGTTPTATSVTFRKSINGSSDPSTYPATIANAASTSMTATKVFGSTDITFNEGDAVRIGFTTNGGTRLLYGFAYTIVLEYNKD